MKEKIISNLKFVFCVIWFSYLLLNIDASVSNHFDGLHKINEINHKWTNGGIHLLEKRIIALEEKLDSKL